MATVSDLFKKLKKPDATPVELDPPEVTASTITALTARDPGQLAEFDQINENRIQQETDTLISHLNVCDDIVNAAYELRKYVPDTINDDQSRLWKEELIPNMLKFVSQDVKARSVLIHAYGAVRDLGIVIQKVSEIVEESDGSETAIGVARKNVPGALKKLEEFIEIATNLENSAINSFASDSEKLFKIVGQEAGDFVKRRSEIDVKVTELFEKQNELWDEYVKCVGEAKRYMYLYQATTKCLADEEAANESTKVRILELEELNKSNETKIEEIKTQIVDSVTVNQNQWSFWKTKKTTFYEMSQNPDRDAEMKYYESLILGRMERLEMEKKSGESYRSRTAELTNSLADFETKFEIAKKKSENLKQQLNRRIEELQKEIDELYTKLNELSSEQCRVEQKIGLSGSALMECLIHIHKYSREIKDGSNAYAPLVSILQGIKAIVQSDIDMLSGTPADIFQAVNRLSKFVGFIAKYYVSCRPVLELSRKKPQLSLTGGETKNVAQLKEI